MDLNIIKEKQPVISKIKEFFIPRPLRPIRIGYFFAGALAFVLIILSLMNFEFRYDDSGMLLSMSIFGKEKGVEDENISKLLQSQQESFNLILEVIAVGEERLKQERNVIIAQLAEEIEKQREVDMQLIDQNISYFSSITVDKFRQNDEVLGRLADYIVAEDFVR